MISVEGVSKRYGDRVAVDDVTFTVQPGVVTGFLGPNGAGKSTTMRLIASLDAPSAGTVLVNGRRYRDTTAPMRELGLLLEARAVHPGRSARNHLLALAQTHGLPRSRVEQMLTLVGLDGVADRRVGGFSLGMGQRLGVAAALLGDPATIVLDEPVNGLDPEGVRWIRTLLRQLAAEGRTVLVSSHLMSEMAQTASRLVVIGRGRLLADTTVEEFVADAGGSWVALRSPQRDAVAAVLTEQAAATSLVGSDGLRVEGMSAEQVGLTVWRAGLPLTELGAAGLSLEEAFMNLTREDTEYGSSGGARMEAAA